MVKISAVVNTRNEEQYLESCLKSLDFVDEIVIVDMESEDKSRDIAYKFTHNVYLHKPMEWVEPARNFGISKATGDWILIIDPDETIPKSLAAKLVSIVDKDKVSFIRIPRQNIIFNEWVKYSRWWPDYNIRFFKKGSVQWQDAIHSIPITYGDGLTLEANEDLSIRHLHYSSLEQYLTRMLRYTDIQAQELQNDGYQFILSIAKNRLFSDFIY